MRTLKEFCAAAQSDHYTPDMSELRSKFSEVPVFVYGDTQYKFSGHPAMGSAQRVGLARTTQTYQMFISNDNEPMIFHTPEPAGARVRGEVYLVTPDVLARLDNRFCNTLHFQRVRRHVKWWHREDATTVNRSEFLSWVYVWEGIAKDLQLHLSGQTPYLRPHIKIKPDATDTTKDYYQFNFIDDKPNRERLSRQRM